MRAITQFIGKHAVLSNFYECLFTHDGYEYRTAEHAFQAAKASTPEAHDRIANAVTPARAKSAGRRVRMACTPAQWNDRRVGIMRDVLRSKFASGPMRAVLQATGDVELIEGNTHRDTYWGVCGGKGQNKLGLILQEIRAEQRDNGPPDDGADGTGDDADQRGQWGLPGQ